MKIQVISDVHIDVNNNVPIIDNYDNSDVCVVCGDIGQPNNQDKKWIMFIKSLSQKFMHVMIVPGNHEYYCCGSSITKLNIIMRELVKPLKNVHILSDDFFVIDDIRFIGTTLWSNTRKYNCDYIKRVMNGYRRIHVEKMVNDHQHIKVKADLNCLYQLHISSVDYIMRQIEETINNKQRSIILSHHLPTFRFFAI